jgi:hypothetical protein
MEVLKGAYGHTHLAIPTGKASMRMSDHKHYVQGVAWDPAGEFLVTQSGDRTCHVYAPVLPSNTSKKQRLQGKQAFDPRYLAKMHSLHKAELEQKQQPQEQQQQPPPALPNADALTQPAAKEAPKVRRR